MIEAILVGVEVFGELGSSIFFEGPIPYDFAHFGEKNELILNPSS